LVHRLGHPAERRMIPLDRLCDLLDVPADLRAG